MPQILDDVLDLIYQEDNDPPRLNLDGRQIMALEMETL
jgi:hypothetical protein